MTAVPPLADLRILAVEQFGAGPWATMQLADLGADVIKIEDPGSGGDVGRYVPPQQAGEDSVYFESFTTPMISIGVFVPGLLPNPMCRPTGLRSPK